MSEFSGFFHAHFVADIGQIRDKLTGDLISARKPDGLVAIVFANAEKEFVQSEILPLVPYWNYRSRDRVHFFFPGYVGDTGINNSESVTAFDPKESFHEQSFVEVIEYFEGENGLSGWDYRGDTPMILCRGYLREHKETKARRAFLDLSSVLEFQLESALREKAIGSVDTFFETIIRAAKQTPGETVHWRLSDQLGIGSVGDAIVDALVSKLPGGKRILDAVRFFRVKQST